MPLASTPTASKVSMLRSHPMMLLTRQARSDVSKQGASTPKRCTSRKSDKLSQQCVHKVAAARTAPRESANLSFTLIAEVVHEIQGDVDALIR
jgi:hypothetical protein